MFKQFTGLTPIEYIKNVRLAKAVDLLRLPGISVANVAMEVGFEDPGYFARQFKQVLGISPSVYQRENSIVQARA
jgi:AraC-like DNA-binding protein